MRFLRVVPVLLICFFVFALSAGSASAAAAKKPAPPPDLRKLVKSVDKANNQIVISDLRAKTSHTYKLDEMSTIQVDGGAAKFADIKAGMEVVDATERDNDDLDSVSLKSRTSAPVAPTAATGAAAVTNIPEKKIESVLVDKNAVVIYFTTSKISRTYHIDANTALKVDGVAGTIGDIKPGMVVADYLERDNDDLDALTLTGYGEEPAPTPPPAAKPKPKPQPKPKPVVAPAASSNSSPTP